MDMKIHLDTVTWQILQQIAEARHQPAQRLLEEWVVKVVTDKAREQPLPEAVQPLEPAAFYQRWLFWRSEALSQEEPYEDSSTFFEGLRDGKPGRDFSWD